MATTGSSSSSNAGGGDRPLTPFEQVAVKPAVPLLTHLRREKEIEPSDKPLDMKTYRRMLRYCRPHRRLLSWLTVCTIVRSAQLPLLSYIVSQIIAGPISTGSTRRLSIAIGIYLALALFTQFVWYYRYSLSQILGETIVHDLRRDIFERLQSLTMAFFYKTKLGRIISRVSSDADIVRQGVQDAIFISIVCVGQMSFALVIMSFTDHLLFGLVLAFAPFYYLTYQYFRKRLILAMRANQESFSRISATLAESVGGIRVTQSFVRQDLNAQAWNWLVVDHSRYNMRTVKAQAWFNPILEFLGAAIVSLLFIVGGYRVLAPHSPATTAGLITFFFLISDHLLGPLGALGNNYAIALNSMAGAERVFNLLDRQPDFTDPSDAVKLPAIVGRVEARELTFAYDPGKPVLHAIHFVVMPGQTVALVGHTGSGKSSIINLISKFYLPTSGELLIDDMDIRRIDAASLHKQMGLVLQSNFLFTGTVMENIRLGRPEATDEEVVAAVKRLDCLDMVDAMPEAFQTHVGERGAGLSLGQRQLVCFARAMLADPRILILDEATSSVDTLTEVRLQQALAALLKGRTSFVVAHRLSTIRHADLVLVLDHGRIVERGTHDDLLAAGGVYADLYLQFIQGGQG